MWPFKKKPEPTIQTQYHVYREMIKDKELELNRTKLALGILEKRVVKWDGKPNEYICYYKDVSFAWRTRNEDNTLRCCPKCGKELITHGYHEGTIGDGLMCEGDYLVILADNSKRIISEEDYDNSHMKPNKALIKAAEKYKTRVV